MELYKWSKLLRHRMGSSIHIDGITKISHRWVGSSICMDGIVKKIKITM
jgi:hypothetical protein